MIDKRIRNAPQGTPSRWMIRRSAAASIALTCVPLLLGGPGCAGEGFGNEGKPRNFRVILAEGTERGTRLDRLAIATEPPDMYTFDVEALNANGDRDEDFEGWVRVDAKPGFVGSVEGENVSGRSVLLRRGRAENITVSLANAYGDTHLVVDELGYIPVDALRDPPPACSDGIDNDGDGLIDYPADPNCAFANDDSEEGGSYSAGISEALYYKLPRAAEVRGYQTGGTRTPFRAQTIQVDTGYREETRDYDFAVVVTRLSSNGFYVTDIEDDRDDADKIGFSNLFAFNFNTPGNLGYCDRIRRLSGTATEFFGSIQLGYPTWAAERWGGPDSGEPCLIPEPRWLRRDDIFTSNNQTNSQVLLSVVHGLVRVQTAEFMVGEVPHRSEIHVSRAFGPGFPRDDDGDDSIFTPPFSFLAFDDPENQDGKFGSNCDFNGDSQIDFVNDPEKSCAEACSANPECTEWSNFAARSNFQISITEGPVGGEQRRAKIQANGSTSPTFSALAARGQSIRSFSGTLGYFSGGSQFTIEARCSDDIIFDLDAQPMPSSEACVARNVVDEEER